MLPGTNCRNPEDMHISHSGATLEHFARDAVNMKKLDRGQNHGTRIVEAKQQVLYDTLYCFGLSPESRSWFSAKASCVGSTPLCCVYLHEALQDIELPIVPSN